MSYPIAFSILILLAVISMVVLCIYVTDRRWLISDIGIVMYSTICIILSTNVFICAGMAHTCLKSMQFLS